MSNKVNNFLEQIRLAELELVEKVFLQYSKTGARVLEIGAGTGWQARKLSDRGFDVQAIDVPGSNHRNDRNWPVQDYDGENIPFPDNSFDIVYSSNVLEHVTHSETLNCEIKRVLKDEGIAVHYVPTTAWRAWSLLSFYPSLIREIFSRISKKSMRGQSALGERIHASERANIVNRLCQRVVPHTHGVRGTFFEELRLFSKPEWDRYFKDFEWSTLEYDVNRLFLTGDELFGPSLDLQSRKLLSSILGSTAHLYVVKKIAFQEESFGNRRGAMSLSAEPVLDLNYGSHLPENVDANILDLGCGTGRMLKFYSAHGYKNIFGVDRDEKILSQIPPIPGVSLECAEVSSKYLQERKISYELIIIKQMLYYVPPDEIPKFITAVQNSMTPDGILIVEFFNSALLSSRVTELKDPFIKTSFTEHSIRRILEAGGMNIIEIYGERRLKPLRLRSLAYFCFRSVWIAILKCIYVLERGVDDELPKIFAKSVVVVAKRN